MRINGWKPHLRLTGKPYWWWVLGARPPANAVLLFMDDMDKNRIALVDHRIGKGSYECVIEHLEEHGYRVFLTQRNNNKTIELYNLT